MRIKKHTSCYIMQNREGEFKKFVKNALAPLEHVFNNHAFCDAAWCWSKEMAEKVDEVLKNTAQNTIRNHSEPLDIGYSAAFACNLCSVTKDEGLRHSVDETDSSSDRTFETLKYDTDDE